MDQRPSYACGIELQFSRDTPLPGGNANEDRFSYRPNWGLPGTRPPEQAGAVVFGFSKSPVLSGDNVKAVIVVPYPETVPQQETRVDVGAVLPMYEGARVCGEAKVAWTKSISLPLGDDVASQFDEWLTQSHQVYWEFAGSAAHDCEASAIARSQDPQGWTLGRRGVHNGRMGDQTGGYRTMDAMPPEPTHGPVLTIEVDGEAFAFRPDGRGGTHYVWLSGPNDGYGFTSSGIRPPLETDGFSLDDHRESIRNFLDQIDPATGFVGG